MTRFLSTVVLAAGPWSAAISAAQAAQQLANEQGPFRYNAGGRRDPFEALVREGRLIGARPEGQFDASEPVLYGILWDAGGHSIALINNDEFKVGDLVGRFRVAEIRQDAVVLTDGGEPLVLQIAFEVAPMDAAPGTTTGGGGL